jgi:hypothetical protein
VSSGLILTVCRSRHIRVARSRRWTSSSGNLLVRDVEVQTAAWRDRVHEGLQLPGGGGVGPATTAPVITLATIPSASIQRPAEDLSHPS